MKNKLAKKVAGLPHCPGIYKFLDQQGEVLYIGKAKSLAQRVGQYFQQLRDGKTRQLVAQITDLQTIEVFSELEALILEAELIKKFKPRYNINLKDDKSYLYVVIRKELGFSKVLTARKNDLLKTDIVFGPFPNGQAAKSVVRAIRRLFPFRDCSQAKFAKYQKLGSPCLYGHIHLCPAPCTDSISQQDYQQNIAHISRFLRGK
ncbi:GIY-YIG nuclease family protein, partial [Patescibacteria group bacterium]|nr:GIY-YIG nuclease family protein [Patescibacteria group bacterium]